MTNQIQSSVKITDTKKQSPRDLVRYYKSNYPLMFTELKLDGFSDLEAIKYIQNRIMDYEYVGLGTHYLENAGAFDDGKYYGFVKQVSLD